MVREKIDKVQTDLQQGRKMEGQRTIFHDLFTNNQLPPGEKTTERLEAEGVGLVAAGYLYPLVQTDAKADQVYPIKDHDWGPDAFRHLV